MACPRSSGRTASARAPCGRCCRPSSTPRLPPATVDVIDGYSTDGLIARHGLVVLEDDRAIVSALRGGGTGERPARARATGRRAGPYAAERATSTCGRCARSTGASRWTARMSASSRGTRSRARDRRSVRERPRRARGGGSRRRRRSLVPLGAPRETARQLGRHLLLVAISLCRCPGGGDPAGPRARTLAPPAPSRSSAARACCRPFPSIALAGVHDPAARHRRAAGAGGAVPVLAATRSCGTPTPVCATRRRMRWPRPGRWG